MLLLPTTTACFPSISVLLLLRSSITPAGVQDLKPLSPRDSLPTLSGWKPSTSLSGLILLITLSSLICFGSGSCTRIPSHPSSALSLSMRPRSSSSDVVSGSSYERDLIPEYSHAFFLLFTYTVDAGSCPTRITARLGSIPSFFPAIFSYRRLSLPYLKFLFYFFLYLLINIFKSQRSQYSDNKISKFEIRAYLPIVPLRFPECLFIKIR